MFIKFSFYYKGIDKKQFFITHYLFCAAFHTPSVRYEKRDTESFLVCSIPSVYPYPHITWKMDNTNVSYSSLQETGAPGPFNISSTLNITGSNSSFGCTIENSLLNQKWRGEWTLAGRFHWTFCVQCCIRGWEVLGIDLQGNKKEN